MPGKGIYLSPVKRTRFLKQVAFKNRDKPLQAKFYKNKTMLKKEDLTALDHIAITIDVPWLIAYEALEAMGMKAEDITIEAVTKCRARIRYIEAMAILTERQKI